MFFFTTVEMAKISEYNLLDCLIRFGGVKKSTIYIESFLVHYGLRGQKHTNGRVLAIEGK